MKLKILKLGMIAAIMIVAVNCGRGAALSKKPSLIVKPQFVAYYDQEGIPITNPSGEIVYNRIKKPLEFCVASNYDSESSQSEIGMTEQARKGYFSVYFKSISVIKYSASESCADQGFDTSVHHIYDNIYIRFEEFKSLPKVGNDLVGFFLRRGDVDKFKVYSK
jgi:hypothetical protein